MNRKFLLGWLLGSALGETILVSATFPCPSLEPSGEHVLSSSGKSCYLPYKRDLNWQEARDFCFNKGGFLAQLPSGLATMEDYLSIYDKLSEKCAWVGLSDSKEEGLWQWMDGSTEYPTSSLWEYDIFTDWLGRWLDCAALCEQNILFAVASSGRWKLSQRSCSENNYLICQIDVPGGWRSTVTETSEAEILHVTTKDIFTRSVTEGFSTNTYKNDTTSTLGLQQHISYQNKVPWTKPSKRKLRPFSEERKKRIVKKISEGSILNGKNIFDKSAFTLSMCARDCLKNTDCRAINFNRVSHRCVGFSSDVNTEKKSNRNWEHWQVY